MDGETLKRTTRAGGIVYGTMLSMARNPRWAAPVAALGLDYVIIDSEHAPRDRGEIADLLAGLRGVDVVPIVRVPVPSSHHVTMALDAGASGVLAPYCETPDEVREVVGAAKWRPLKGELLRRAVELGEFPSGATRDYLLARNRHNVCIIGIESAPAMEALDDIVAIKGVDAIFVGPNDLSISLGVPDRYDHPVYEAALRAIIAACRARGLPVLIHHQTAELTRKWLREGARFVLHSTETRAVHNAFREEFGAIRATGEEVDAFERGIPQIPPEHLQDLVNSIYGKSSGRPAPLVPTDTATHLLLCEQVTGVLATLTRREWQVLQLRFGLAGNVTDKTEARRRTQKEVGRQFSLSGSRIQQIEAKALRKLRHPSRLRLLEKYLG